MTGSSIADVEYALPNAAHRPSSRDLPSLDGLRAISIAFVILGHACHGYVSPRVEVLLARLAHFGVCVFFVISGYLITTLLRRDLAKRATISLHRFYFRRTLRIFPPYFVYLGVVAVGAAYFGLTVPADVRWWPALFYVSNFFNTNWALTGHGWSLSLEEQFYLTWPMAIALCVRHFGNPRGARVSGRIALFALLFFPLVRMVSFAITRDGGLAGAFIFDYVAAGSAVALMESDSSPGLGRSVLDEALNSGLVPLAAVAALLLHVALSGTTRWLFAVDVVFATPLEAALLALFVAWAIRNPKHPIGRVLNTRPLRIIGVGSYSLYLWQQLFFGPGGSFTHDWPVWWRVIAAGVCTSMSYFVVERPSLRLRQRLELRLFARL